MDLLEGYINLHDQEVNNTGGYQDTLNLLKEIHVPIQHIIRRSGLITDKNRELLDRFQDLSFKAISKEKDDEDMPF